MSKLKDYGKVRNVIESCKTLDQLEVADRMRVLFDEKYPHPSGVNWACIYYSDLHNRYLEKTKLLIGYIEYE